ncbi:hypothetical protein [Undibacterium crateris]|uniref:hypothetical protein n=1 Tax=Undibacterium crateris TaxID=2528175 RepID=UPI001389DB7A|nr:hypothetical protein [Undibacterium crateris]NDI85389.1 hypothetical protein [Undibacterium crateris]
MKKILHILSLAAIAASLSACISVSEQNVEASKQISVMAAQATATCGQGNVDKVSTSSFTCKQNTGR